MFGRQPWILMWWITKDLLRLVVLCALVMVSVIALSATVKPVSDGLLSAENFVKFVLFALPPMLAFALPFAASFGATLVYHKFASSNEALAAYAGGVSHRAVLVPALVVGLFFALVLGVLNEVAIPRLLLQMQRLITRDLTTWVVQEIDKGKSVEIGGFSMLAQSARRAPPPPNSFATDVLYLTKVAAMERDAKGDPSTEVTAERAWIMLYPAEDAVGTGSGGSSGEAGRSRVMMRLENVVGSKEGQGGGGARKSLDLGWMLGSGFRDSIKFLSWQQLREIIKYPERLNWVDAARRDVAYRMAERRAISMMQETVTLDQRLLLLDEVGEPVVVRAGSMTPVAGTARTWELLPAGAVKAITLSLKRPGVSGDVTQTLVETARAVLTVDVGTDRFDRDLQFHIDMENVTVSDLTGAGTARASGEQRSERTTYRVAGLKAQPDPLTPLMAMGSYQLLEAADAVLQRDGPGAGATELLSARDGLLAAVTRTLRQATAKRHERMAMAVSCVVMSLTGGLVALRLSRRLPVVVYIFTFVPAALCLVLMVSGQQVTVQQGMVGLYVVWSGVVVLTFYTAVQYLLVSRH